MELHAQVAETCACANGAVCARLPGVSGTPATHTKLSPLPRHMPGHQAGKVRDRWAKDIFCMIEVQSVILPSVSPFL